jgi:hypothetical protein
MNMNSKLLQLNEVMENTPASRRSLDGALATSVGSLMFNPFGAGPGNIPDLASSPDNLQLLNC